MVGILTEQPFVARTEISISIGFEAKSLTPEQCAIALAFATGVIIAGAWLASIPVGMVIALIVYMGQMKWYDDDHESALIKALIVGFLTAIPTSLPGYLTIPAGVIGIFRKK